MHFFVQKAKFFSFLSLAAGLLTGCMVGPRFQSPSAPLVESYTGKSLPARTVTAAQAGPAGKAQFFVNGKDLPAEWWSLFHSKEINALVYQGLANSPDLESARAALEQTQEKLKAQVGSSFFPALSAQVNASRQAFSNGIFGGSGSRIFNLFNPALNISYNVDIFGGFHRQVEAGMAQLDYQRFELEAAYLSLTANIVSTAITMAALEEKIKATHELIDEQVKTLEVVQEQFKLGGASGSEVLAQQTQLAQLQTTLSPLEQSLAQTRDLLSTLIGVLPEQSRLPTLDFNHLYLPQELPLSLPSSLVKQRPDVQAAEALLHVASAQVGLATANLFPQITLSGSYGWVDNNVANIFAAQNLTWNITGQLLQPIFNAGSLRATQRAAVAGFEKTLAQYRKVVLQAFQNVADSLHAIQNNAQAFKAYAAAEKAAHAALVIARQQYRLGAVSYLSLLDAERQYQQIHIARIQAQLVRYTDTVALFQALGGGWWNRRNNGV